MAKKIGKEFLVFSFLAIAIFHSLSLANSWYWIFTWLDIPMHFLGGAWLAIFFFFALDQAGVGIVRKEKSAPFLRAFFVVGLVVLFGVLWEFMEFFYDLFISRSGYALAMQGNSGDTMGDLFMDIVGGAFVAAFRFFSALSSK